MAAHCLLAQEPLVSLPSKTLWSAETVSTVGAAVPMCVVGFDHQTLLPAEFLKQLGHKAGVEVRPQCHADYGPWRLLAGKGLKQM